MKRDDIMRRWWAEFVMAPVAKDGQVKGFRQAWDKMTPEARALCDRYERAAVTKIDRDGRDPDECIASSVKACRRELSLMVPATPIYPQVEAVNKLVSTILRGMG